MQVISLRKPFASMSNKEGHDILGAELRHAISKPKLFVPQPIVPDQMLSPDVLSSMGLSTTQDVLKHMGANLAMHCWRMAPSNAGKEARRREVISPVILLQP